jgi:hypothetical protein
MGTLRLSCVGAVVALLSGWAWAANPSPSPETIRGAARTLLAGKDFNLQDEAGAHGVLLEILAWGMERVGDFFDRLLPDDPAVRGIVFWIVVPLLCLLIVGLIAHIVYSLYRGLRPTAEHVESDKSDTRDWPALVAESERLAAAGDYVDASRRLYRAALVRLEEARGGRVQHGLTNNEYLGTFRSPWVTENLRVFADLINWKWYRARSFEEEDYRRCREAYNRLDLRLREDV